MSGVGSITGIQGQPLEVTVVCCSKLKDTEWISRQDPYVCLEYGSTKFRTRTCTDGGKNPLFHEKFTFPLIEGLREINVIVWNSNTLTFDDFIGTGKIQLHKVLSQGFDDSAWPLQTKTGRYAGEVKLILHYTHQQNSASSHHTPPPYAYMPTQYNSPPPPSSYYPQPQPHSNSAPFHPPPAYPPYSSQYSSPYPPPPSSYSYPPPSSSSPYPPGPHSYPPSSYPPPPAAYPPNAPGIYPPPPY
ncbi:elicitor-responsive protein 3 [Cicer arietinum]|uniref:Leucine-rich repeat extensin-like protein 3 n=1 Tax=Cicer arietinum TaxID=3827 RepID=A0A1S2YWZ8_CICAR|nr:leucine-rich repeat extensin-like protein 3 [Cicer arietinum]